MTAVTILRQTHVIRQKFIILEGPILNDLNSSTLGQMCTRISGQKCLGHLDNLFNSRVAVKNLVGLDFCFAFFREKRRNENIL